MSDTTTADPQDRILDAGAAATIAEAEAAALLPDKVEAEAPASLGALTFDKPDLPVTPEHSELYSMAQLAKTFAQSKLVPKELQGDPPSTLLVMLEARSLGIDYPTAFREMWVSNGRVAMKEQMKLALVRRSRLGKIWPDPDNDRTSATWYAIRADDPDVTYRATFTIEDAAGIEARERDRTLPLSETNTYKQYPADMLSWRACGKLMRMAFSEVGVGIYSPAELGAITDNEGNVIEISEVSPLVSTPKEERKAERATAAAELAPEVERLHLQARIDHLPEDIRLGEGGLRDRWRAGGLVPVTKLPVNQIRRASSMIKGFESKAKATVEGWEPWTPDAETPSEAPDASGRTDTPDEVPAAQETPQEPAISDDQPQADPDSWPEVPADLQAQIHDVVIPQVGALVKDVPESEVNAMGDQIKAISWQAVNSALLDDYGVPQRVVDELHIDARRMLLTGYRLGERPMA